MFQYSFSNDYNYKSANYLILVECAFYYVAPPGIEPEFKV